MAEESTRDIEPDLPEEGDQVLPSTKAMGSSGMWVHSSVGILNNCRTTHMEQEPEDDTITPEELMAKIEAADPYDPRLKPIDSDTKVTVSKSSKMNPWVVKLMGDSSEYKTENGK